MGRVDVEASAQVRARLAWPLGVWLSRSASKKTASTQLEKQGRPIPPSKLSKHSVAVPFVRSNCSLQRPRGNGKQNREMFLA